MQFIVFHTSKMTDSAGQKDPPFSEEQAQYLQSLVSQSLVTVLAEQWDKEREPDRGTDEAPQSLKAQGSGDPSE